VVLRDTACIYSKIHATPRTNRAELDLCVGDVRARAWLLAAISVNAIIEINVFDYNVHARARTCTRVHVRSVNEA